MDNNVFNEIVTSLKNLIADLDDSYRIIPLKGEKEGKTVSRVIVVVCDQSYLQVDSDLFFAFNEIFPQTKYQKAKYYCAPDKDGHYSLFKEGKEVLSKSDFSIDLLFNEVFGDLKDKFQNKQEVAKLLGKLMKHGILPNKLGYDAYAQTYFFLDGYHASKGNEYLWFSNYFQDLKKYDMKPSRYEYGHVAKYTSLDTAFKILDSCKMRMMSVTAMNDKLEIGHLYGKLSNEYSAELENKTIFHNARHRYITSFTEKIDDLTMWRLYGDDGKGVCLVFSEPVATPYYFPIDYSGERSIKVLESKRICDELLNKYGIRFTFKSLESIWQYFLKREGFKDECEMRYLRIDKSKPDGYDVASNGVISSYTELSLTGDENNSEKVFPASLQGIILGPNMKNAEWNKLQLEAIAIEKGLPLFKGVQRSSINYYLS